MVMPSFLGSARDLLRALAIVAALAGVAVVAPEGAAMLAPALVVALLLAGWPVATQRTIAWVRRVLRRRRGRIGMLDASVSLPARPTWPSEPLAFALATRPPPRRAH